MTRKHFEALAEALRTSYPLGMRDTYTAVAGWETTCKSVAATCRQFNPSFNRARFLAACIPVGVVAFAGED
jgi:hypothetical protein